MTLGKRGGPTYCVAQGKANTLGQITNFSLQNSISLQDQFFISFNTMGQIQEFGKT